MAIYTNSVMNSVLTTIASNQTIVNCGVVVEQYQIINTNPEILYWLNITEPIISIEPRRSNITEPWMQEISITVQCQTQNYPDIALQVEAARQLIALRDNVWSAVNSNRTLDNTVNILTGGTMSPLDRDEIQSDDFLMSQLTFTAEAFA